MPGNDNMDNMTDTGPTAQELDEERQRIKGLATAATTAVNAVNDEATDDQVTAADNALTALKSPIDGASDALEGDPEVSRAQGTHETLTTILDVAKTSRQTAIDTAKAETEKEEAERRKEEQAALNEMAMKLNAAIVVSRPVSGSTVGGAADVSNESFGAGSGVEIHSTPFHIGDDGKPFSNAGNPVVIGDSMVTLQRMENGAPDTAENRELKLTDQPVASLGGWQGKRYERKNADDKVLDTAVIYTNQDPPKRELFATKHATILGNNNGQIPNASLADLMPMSEDFRTTPGIKDHQLPASVTTRPNYISIAGTLDGAPGQFRCGTTIGTDDCTSKGDTDGRTQLGAGWYFVADAGAMTSTPDDKYAGFGWWAQEDSNGADGFYVVVIPSNDADAKFVLSETGGGDVITAFKGLSGTATYNGHAAGKVAIHQPLSSDGNVAGTFTANVALTVDFGAVTTGTINGADARLTGTIDGFMVNDVAMDDWTVKFVKNEADDAVGGFADGGGITYRGNTEWSIGDTKGDGMGKYDGVYLDQADSGLMRATVGNFTAQYGTVGSMTGGFGATTD